MILNKLKIEGKNKFWKLNISAQRKFCEKIKIIICKWNQEDLWNKEKIDFK